MERQEPVSYTHLVNNPANADEVSQDNYICYKKENGILDFPFVMGCKIILQSVETGKKYVVLEDINPLKGVAESAIIGNNILYYKQFMGEPVSYTHLDVYKRQLLYRAGV